jgi:hypothetical protein
MSATLNVRDLCDRFKVGEGTVLGWIQSGELAAINVGRTAGKKKPRWRITPEALAAFELSRSVAPSASPVRRRKRTTGSVIEFIK